MDRSLTSPTLTRRKLLFGLCGVAAATALAACGTAPAAPSGSSAQPGSSSQSAGSSAASSGPASSGAASSGASSQAGGAGNPLKVVISAELTSLDPSVDTVKSSLIVTNTIM